MQNFLQFAFKQKVCQTSSWEKKWCEFSPIESDMVKMIDTQKVINIKDKSVAEFNYQLLNNLLNCNKQLSKLKRGQSNECPNCHLAENIFH